MKQMKYEKLELFGTEFTAYSQHMLVYFFRKFPPTPCDDAPVAELGVDARLKFQRNPSMKAFPLEQKLLITSNVRKQDLDTNQLWRNPQPC